jgi:hypothetical protein
MRLPPLLLATVCSSPALSYAHFCRCRSETAGLAVIGTQLPPLPCTYCSTPMHSRGDLPRTSAVSEPLLRFSR